MEELNNKTIMCSVFFLDIVGYSKKSVAGQISLKDRFNSYLSAAIRDVPITDRIILDTGDGAAINFLGDIEDALKAALSLRESLLNEDSNLNYPLLVRMGINLGPVRLVRDINGQPNIVGDGINVAQRVMGFADASQVLVSRSYFDAVSRLSPQYAEMFHYQGSRTDKHVREHEVYAIGYPSDTTNPRLAKKSKKAIAKAMDNTRTSLRPAVLGWQFLQANLLQGFSRAGPVKRVLYAVSFLIFLLVMLELTEEKLISNGTSIMSTDNNEKMTGSFESNPVAVSTASSAPAVLRPKANDTILAHPRVKIEPEKQKVAPNKKSKENPPSLEAEHKINMLEAPVKMQDVAIVDNQQSVNNGSSVDNHQSVDNSNSVDTQLTDSQSANILVTCKEGAEVFVDGSRKGKVSTSSLFFPVSPGRHLVIVSHAKGMDWKIIKFKAGVTVSVNPDFCNE
jgi:hypothetical protein